MKLLRNAITKTSKDQNIESVRHLEITEVVLVYCNIVKKDYQQDSRALHAFIHNELFGQLLDISRKNVIFKKHFI